MTLFPVEAMPWKDHLRRAKGEWDSLRSQSRAAQAPAAYWQPRFRPEVPVCDEWDAKIGNDADCWGNRELQHYTAAADNIFQCVKS